MFGSLVIRQPAQADPHSHLYDHDLPEHVLIVTDWYHETAEYEFADFLYNFTGYSRRELQPKSIVLNGKKHSENYFGFSQYEIFEIEKGQRYRFRVIDTGIAACQLVISIDGHVLTLISTDGNPVHPYEVTSIALDSADRYDFIVHANRKVGNYWLKIEAVCVLDCFQYTMVFLDLLSLRVSTSGFKGSFKKAYSITF